MEGIRSKFDPIEEEPKSNQDKIINILSDLQEIEGSGKLFDLAIIDEAHYLRNPATASNRTATYIRDNAESLVLLSATPVQTSSENLFHLLKLLAPEDYYDYRAFQNAIDENKPILDAIALINKNRTTYSEIIEISNNLDGLIDNKLLKKIKTLYKDGTPSAQDRVDMSWQLSEYSYLNEYMNRTRKRDVHLQSVVREAHTVLFSLTEKEKDVYISVSTRIKTILRNQKKTIPFVLILRQRHMTSCLPMGVLAYKNSIKEELDDYESEYYDENISFDDIHESLPPIEISDNLISELIRLDSKYKEVLKNLKNIISSNKDEKIIIFSFFRSTIEYLAKRIKQDGLSVSVIKGGMGDLKYDVLTAFADVDGPNILLSTEVGAEGIDLQFARVLINYDLPWNPMRIEQRIGRIDRIGQKSDKISIFNLVCDNTIEDRVLARLYRRIQVFTHTVGELDEILGDKVEKLMLDIINEDLSEGQALQRVDSTALAIENNRRDQDVLEDQAINLLGFNDFIMQSIHNAKDRSRYIEPKDLTLFIEDFFAKNYKGSRIKERYQDNEYLRMILLSLEAKVAFSNYLRKNPPIINSRLPVAENSILCVFDHNFETKIIGGRYHEKIEIKHPLIQWILKEYENNPESIFKCSNIVVSNGYCDIPAGQYVYLIHRWDSSGSIDRKELKFFATSVIGKNELAEKDQELLIKAALQNGVNWHDHSIEIDLDKVNSCYKHLSNNALVKFDTYMENLSIDHEIRIEKQKRYAKSVLDRRINILNAKIEKLIINQRPESIIRMNKGQITRAEDNYQKQLLRIEGKAFEPTLIEVSAGVIKVEEE